MATSSSNPGQAPPSEPAPAPRPAPAPATTPPPAPAPQSDPGAPPPPPTPTQEEADAIREGRYDASAPAGQRVKKKAMEPASSDSGYTTR